MLASGLRRLPLTDRTTYSFEIGTALFYGLFNGLTLSLSTIVARRIGVSSTQLSVMLAMPFVGALFSLYFGHLAAKRDKMAFVFWPGITSRFLLACVALVSRPTPFFLLMSAFYLLSSVSGPAYAGIMKSNYSDQYRGRLMGNTKIVAMATAAVFSYIAGAALEWSPSAYRWLFPLGAAFGMFASLLFRRLRVRRGTDHPVPRGFSFLQAWRALRSDRSYILFLSLLFLCAAPNKLAIPLEPIWLVDQIGMDYHQAGYILGTVTFVCSIVGYLASGWVSTRMDPLWALVCTILLFVGRYLTLALARTPLHVLPASALSGLGSSCFEMFVLFTVIRFARGGSLPLYSGLHSTFVGVRGIIGPFIGNYLYLTAGVSISGVFWIIAALTAGGMVALALFARSRHRVAAGSAPGRS